MPEPRSQIFNVVKCFSVFNYKLFLSFDDPQTVIDACGGDYDRADYPSIHKVENPAIFGDELHR
jgi:hypothetical protein